MFWVYILRCADGSYYTGHTDNLEKRMGQYHVGECDGYVVSRRPVILAWSQECATRQEALSAERQIKGWSRKKKEAMMQGNWEEVSILAKSKTTAVRPELVEGQNTKAVRGLTEGLALCGCELVKPQIAFGQSAHPSTSSGRTATSSGRTDLLLQEASVWP